MLHRGICMRYTLDLFQDVSDGRDYTRDGVPAQHSHHGNYGKAMSAHFTECMRRWAHCTVLASRTDLQPLHIGHR